MAKNFQKLLSEYAKDGSRFQKPLADFIIQNNLEVIVETGSGESSLFILKALDYIGRGRLYSIDPEPLCKYEAEHERYTFIKKKSVDALSELYHKTGAWDLFLHDSDHEIECQTFEYEVAYACVRKGGFIFSDDYTWGNHGAWERFCKKYNLVPFELGFIQGVQKLSDAIDKSMIDDLIKQEWENAQETGKQWREVNHSPVNILRSDSDIVFNWCMKNSQPKVALDIGANIGEMTNIMIEKGFVVHAFEPVPIPFQELYSSFGKNEKVKCHKLGMSDKEGELKDTTVCIAWTLGTPETTGLSVKPEYKNYPHFDVKFTTIDKYVSDNNLKIGFIKLDVDGYELKVLKGGEKTIREQMPPMMIELSAYIKSITGSEEEYVKFIFDLGYVILSMDGENIFYRWEQVKEFYPYNSSFDVMLLTESDANKYADYRGPLPL